MKLQRSIRLFIELVVCLISSERIGEHGQTLILLLDERRFPSLSAGLTMY